MSVHTDARKHKPARADHIFCHLLIILAVVIEDLLFALNSLRKLSCDTSEYLRCLLPPRMAAKINNVISTIPITIAMMTIYLYLDTASPALGNLTFKVNSLPSIS